MVQHFSCVLLHGGLLFTLCHSVRNLGLQMFAATAWWTLLKVFLSLPLMGGVVVLLLPSRHKLFVRTALIPRGSSGNLENEHLPHFTSVPPGKRMRQRLALQASQQSLRDQARKDQAWDMRCLVAVVFWICLVAIGTSLQMRPSLIATSVAGMHS